MALRFSDWNKDKILIKRVLDQAQEDSQTVKKHTKQLALLGVDSSGSTTTIVGSSSSITLAMPEEFTVFGAPLVGSGTITATWATQLPGTVFAGPNVSAGLPTFRALTSADIPTVSLLDATRHEDTATAPVERGALITGQGAAPTLWTVLTKGTANQVLTMDATATDVIWATPASSGGWPRIFIGMGA